MVTDDAIKLLRRLITEQQKVFWKEFTEARNATEARSVWENARQFKRLELQLRKEIEKSRRKEDGKDS